MQDKQNLCERLAQLTREGVLLYENMSGTANAPERVINALVMSELYKQDDYESRLEVNAVQFREDLHVPEAQALYDSFDDVRPHFLDAVLWNTDGALHGIIEFKKGPSNSIPRDIQRTSKLMSAAKFVMGYEVVALVTGHAFIDGEIAEVKRKVADLNCIGPIYVGEKFDVEPNDEGVYAGCACIVVIPVFPSGR
jgi:hypothetical protein